MSLIKPLPGGKSQLSSLQWFSNAYSLKVRGKKNLALKQSHDSCLSSCNYVSKGTDIYQPFDCWCWLDNLVSQRGFSCFPLATASKTPCRETQEVGYRHGCLYSPYKRYLSEEKLICETFHTFFKKMPQPITSKNKLL